LKIRSQHHRILPRTSLDLHLTYHPSLYPSCIALDFLSFIFLFSLSFLYSLSLSLSLSLFLLCGHTLIYSFLHIFIFYSEAFRPSFCYEYQSEF
jgi:hypothetical protein